MIKLNLGCYDRKIYDFINVDIRSETQPDVVDNIFTLTKFQNNSINLIYCCHTLEHLNKQDAIQALKRWYNLLISGGLLRLSVPDIERHCAHYVYHKDLSQLFSAFWGSQRHKYDYHKCGWDFITLKNDLTQVGFINIQKYNWQNTEHSYIDDYSQAYYPHMDKESGMLMSLNVEGTKP